ncbi:PAS domain S-box protein [Methylobacterium oryzae CBMB20]
MIGRDLRALPPVFDWRLPSGIILEVRRSPLADGGAVLTFSDVTQNRIAERATEESERRYRLLAENATDIIIWSDLTTCRRYVSPAVRTVLGYDPDDLVGTQPLDFVHPDDVAAYRDVLDGLTSGRSARALTSQRYRHRDGHWVWLEISFSLTQDAATGEADGYVATLRDISARKAAEDALRLSEARYRALADALPQLVWIAATETGEASYVNRRFEDYYGPIGPSRAARIARNHPEDADRMERLWRAARERRTAYEVEGRLQRHDGAYRWHSSCSCRSGRARRWWACWAPPSTSTRSWPRGARSRRRAASCSWPSRPPRRARGASISTPAGSTGRPRARACTGSRRTGITRSTRRPGSP